AKKAGIIKSRTNRVFISVNQFGFMHYLCFTTVKIRKPFLMNTLRPAFIAFLLLLGWTNMSSAQMFSVDDDQDRPTRITTNSLMVGIAPADFTFRGAATPGRVPLEFTGIMYSAVLESPTLVVYSAFNPDIGTGGNITAFNIGASVQNRFMLRGGARSAFYIPFRITTDWRTARNKTEGDDSSEFQQSS